MDETEKAALSEVPGLVGRDLTSNSLSTALDIFRLVKNSDIQYEKRKHRRFLLELPLDYRLVESSSTLGGIVLNAGEGGFLIRSFREMAVGSTLNITVLFPYKFQLATFEAVAQIVRKERRVQGQSGIKYGLRIVRINDMNYLKLRYVLASSTLIQG